jgi:DNA-binding protein HU-beta
MQPNQLTLRVQGHGQVATSPDVVVLRGAAEFLESLVAIAYREAKKNGEFTLPGIGKLVKQKRKARIGTNPKTGEKIKIAAKTVVKMRVAKAAKDAVLGAK